jgi:hypothetical protein
MDLGIHTEKMSLVKAGEPVNMQSLKPHGGSFCAAFILPASKARIVFRNWYVAPRMTFYR